ncbi:hypothetical protein GF323_01275 [Candidatus Woesearchaeota archaeon]|nr:hypothetical protein [Candidatus Woesearchaeota archaeon]
MKKKAVLGLSLTQLMGVIFAIIVLIAASIAFARFLGIFTTTKDAKAKNNFKAITYEIRKLVETPYPYVYREYYPFYLPSNLILVGHDRQSIKTQCTNEFATNNNCHNKPCLCLYEDTLNDDFDGAWLWTKSKQIIECYEFNKDITFLAPFDNNKGIFSGEKKPSKIGYYEGESNYEDMFLYGNGCGTNNFGVAKLYLEKFQDPETGKVFIYISQQDKETNESIKERISYLNNKYSEKTCKDMLYLIDIKSLEAYSKNIIKESEKREIPIHEIPMGDKRTYENSIPIAEEFIEYYDISLGEAVVIIDGNADLDMERIKKEIESRVNKKENTIKYPKRIVIPDTPEKTEITETCHEITKKCFQYLPENFRKICTKLTEDV